MHERLVQQGIAATKDDARAWLRDNALIPHHATDRLIQLVPRALHALPHVGSAADMRYMRYKNER